MDFITSVNTCDTFIAKYHEIFEIFDTQFPIFKMHLFAVDWAGFVMLVFLIISCDL